MHKRHLVMLLGHSKLGQPEFSAPIPGQCPVDTILNLTSSPLAEILQDHHQLLRGGCVVMGSQVVEPEVRFLLIFGENQIFHFLKFDSPAAELLTGCVESIEPLGVSVAHGRRNQDL